MQFSVGIPSSMSKFNVKIGKCDGAVVIGDSANLTIGATQGKEGLSPQTFRSTSSLSYTIRFGFAIERSPVKERFYRKFVM